MVRASSFLQVPRRSRRLPGRERRGDAGAWGQDQAPACPAGLTPVPSAVPERGLRCPPGRPGDQPPRAPQEEQLADGAAQGQLRPPRAARLPPQAQPPAQDHVRAAARPARQPQARARPEPARVRQGPRAAPVRAQLGARAPQVRVGALRVGCARSRGPLPGCLRGRERPPSPGHRPFPAFSLPCLSSRVRPQGGGALPGLGGLPRPQGGEILGLSAATAASPVPVASSPNRG